MAMENDRRAQGAAISSGSEFIKRLIDLGDEFDLRVTPAAAAAFYGQDLQAVILRDLHSKHAETWGSHPEPRGKK